MTEFGPLARLVDRLGARVGELRDAHQRQAAELDRLAAEIADLAGAVRAAATDEGRDTEAIRRLAPLFPGADPKHLNQLTRQLEEAVLQAEQRADQTAAEATAAEARHRETMHELDVVMHDLGRVQADLLRAQDALALTIDRLEAPGVVTDDRERHHLHVQLEQHQHRLDEVRIYREHLDQRRMAASVHAEDAARAAADAAARAERQRAEVSLLQSQLSTLRALRNERVHVAAEELDEPHERRTLSMVPDPETLASLSAPVRHVPPTAREVVLQALQLLQTMLSADELSSLAPFFGLPSEKLGSRRFGPLRRDEQNSFASSTTRTLWLAAGLDADGNAVRALWARSDWPLVDRIVVPGAERWRLLRVAARACELAQQPTFEISGAPFTRWALTAATRASITPAEPPDRPRWRTAELVEKCVASARAALGSPEAREDEALRHKIAARLQDRVPDGAAPLLFGADVVVTGGNR